MEKGVHSRIEFKDREAEQSVENRNGWISVSGKMAVNIGSKLATRVDLPEP